MTYTDGVSNYFLRKKNIYTLEDEHKEKKFKAWCPPSHVVDNYQAWCPTSHVVVTI